MSGNAIKNVLLVGTFLLLFPLICFAEIGSREKPQVQGTTPEKELKTIIVDNYYPYTFVNEHGTPDGFSVDLLKAVAQVMGLKVQIDVDTWEVARGALKAGEIDVLPMMAYSKERDRVFDFSVPHTIAYDAFFTRKNGSQVKSLDDLRGKRIIVMKDDQAHDYLRLSGLTASNDLILVDSLPNALRLLAEGKGDAALMPKLVGLIVAKNLHLKNIELSPIVIDDYDRPFSFSVVEGNQPLLERLTQGLNIVKTSDQYDQIYEKWFGGLTPPGFSLGRVLKYIGMTILVFLVIASILLLWSFSLRRQVALRTRNLNREISERKQIERALRDSERELVSAQHIAKMGNFMWDVETGRVTWSDALFDLLQYDKNERMDYEKVNREIHHPEDLARVTRWLNDAISSGKTALPANEYRLIRKDGEVIYVRGMGAIERIEGEAPKVFGTVQDITESKKAEDEIRQLNRELELRVRQRTAKLEETNKELEDFVYSVSHDLRAPLRSISGFAQIIDRRHKTSLDDEGRHYVDNIIQASKDMGELIDDLLAFSRLGRKSVMSEAVSLQDVLGEAMDHLSETINETNARIRLPDRFPSIQGDARLATHVFINLLENALKYHKPDEPPKIDVRFDSEDSYVVISVADNGIGIEPRYHDKIFNIFQRLHSQADYTGTGIGLAAVKKSVQMMDGEVWVESEPDSGSVFKIRFKKAITT